MRIQKARSIVVSCLLVTASAAEAASPDRVIGSYISIHGDPAPSVLGINLALQPVSWLRFVGGVGGYDADYVNTPIGVANYTVMPVAYVFYALGHLMLTGGKKPKKWRDFRFDSLPEDQTVLTYGTGAKLRAPLFKNLYSLFGAHWSHSRVKGGTWGLPPRFEHWYYSGTLEAEFKDTNASFNVGTGFNYCPDARDAACGFFVTLGAMF